MTAEVVPYEGAAPVTLFGTDDPSDIIKIATEKAEVLARVIRSRKLASIISGREYVRLEGWTLLGTMLGVFPICVWSRQIENGWEARAEARTLDGKLVGAAEAQCARDENTWKSRSDYALRSMAQTRASSKALRLPLGFVMALAGYDPTPAEEIDEGPRPTQPTAPRQQNGSAPTSRATRGSGGNVSAFWAEARKLGDKDAMFLKVQGLTGNAGVGGKSQAELDALLKELQRSVPGGTCKHEHTAYDMKEDVARLVCSDCGTFLGGEPGEGGEPA